MHLLAYMIATPAFSGFVPKRVHGHTICLRSSKITTLYPHSWGTDENVTVFSCQIKVNPRSNPPKSFFFLSFTDEECRCFAGLER